MCNSSVFNGLLTLSSLGLSVCLSQSQTPFCRANESPLNPWSKLFWYNGSVLASGYRGTGLIPAILINFFVFFTAEEAWGGMESE